MNSKTYRKELSEYLNRLSNMSEQERSDFIKAQEILNESEEEIPTLDIPIEEYCRRYGYVDLDDFFNKLK